MPGGPSKGPEPLQRKALRSLSAAKAFPLPFNLAVSWIATRMSPGSGLPLFLERESSPLHVRFAPMIFSPAFPGAAMRFFFAL
jgi:hypothetical protein